jgi:spore germination cell wall hydrolase CwlJ-like protein
MEATNMNAVIDKMQKFCDTYHDMILKVGGIFAFAFLCIFVPGHNLQQARSHSNDQAQILLAKDEAYQQLQQELSDLKAENQYYKASLGERRFLFNEIQCLAKNIYFEAASEPLHGKIAVAQVTMNRVRSNRYPGTVCGVVYQRNPRGCQFSWVCEGTKSIRDGEGWKQSLRIAEEVLLLKRKYSIISASAKYYHADYVNPRWAAEKTLVAKIGRHMFYH